jgi:IS5 family transposase
MLSTKKSTPQLGLFLAIEDQVNQKHPLYLLSHKINWNLFDDAFKKHYSEKMGKPAKPIRLMVSLLILKHLRNLSDENLVEQWAENIYFQYFGGEQHFQPNIPCVPTELIAFRQRIGEEGVELILKESIRVNAPDDKSNHGEVVSVDTTVQEKNITYPTDDKLYKKIIKKCWKISDKELIDLRQSYVRVVKELSTKQRFKSTKHGAKTARKASKKIKTIAGRLVRELERKLTPEGLSNYSATLQLFKRILAQKRSDSNKVYSIHEPEVKCYSKGKEHKKFEFGSKASIVIDQTSGIIMGACNFSETIHDSKTLPEALDQFERLNDKQPKEVFVDRGYRGIKQYKESQILVPTPNKNMTSKQRKKHSRRAAIEPTIGHLKHDHRLYRNYLKGIIGDSINLILAAAAMNFKRRINLWQTEAIRRWLLIYRMIIGAYWNFIAQNLKPTF